MSTSIIVIIQWKWLISVYIPIIYIHIHIWLSNCWQCWLHCYYNTKLQTTALRAHVALRFMFFFILFIVVIRCNKVYLYNVYENRYTNRSFHSISTSQQALDFSLLWDNLFFQVEQILHVNGVCFRTLHHVFHVFLFYFLICQRLDI